MVVLDRFRHKYPECLATSGNYSAQSLLSDVLKELYGRLPIIRQTEVTLNVTDGTREYAFDVDVTAIQEIIYKPTADETGWVVLSATNIDKLDASDPYWRTDLTEGPPDTYYIKGAPDSDTAKNMIGFIPIPDTTTSGGYPIVAMQVTKWAALTASETMPSNLLNDNVLVYGMRYYWAIERDDDNAIQKWKTLYEDEISKNAIHLRNLMGDDDPTYIASPVFTLTQSV